MDQYQEILTILKALGYGDPEGRHEIIQSIEANACGDCQECCYIAHVYDESIAKPPFTKCKHQCASGCAIHATKPHECKAFSCMWKCGIVSGDRPDISGVMWWIAHSPNGRIALRLDIDLSKAKKDAIKYSKKLIDDFVIGRDLTVEVRFRGDKFWFTLAKSKSPGSFDVCMVNDFIDGEPSSDQLERVRMAIPAARDRLERGLLMNRASH